MSVDESAVEKDGERGRLLARILDGLGGDARPGLLAQVEASLARQGDAAAELRFLKDLDIFLSLPGPAFMYSRGIAETLRVGEEIFELAYTLRKAKENA